MEQKDSELESRVSSLESRFSKVKPPIKKSDGEIRGEIALNFTKWFFGSLVGTFILTLLYNLVIIICKFDLKPLELKDTILLVSGVLGGMYGLVLGYYFQSNGK